MHGRRLRQLHAEVAAVEAVLLQAGCDVVGQARVAGGSAREIHHAGGQLKPAGPQRCQLAAGARDHPAVHARHHAVALGGGNEGHRRHQLPVRAAHPQQQLEAARRRAAAAVVHRADLLRDQHELVAVQGGLQPLHPVHLAPALLQLRIVGLVKVHAVTAVLLGGIAGLVGGRQGIGHRAHVAAQRHHADAGGDGKRALAPVEALRGDLLAQPGGQWRCRLQRVARQQKSELVTAQARQRTGLPHQRAYPPGELPEQLVAGGMAAGVIDHLELVEVEVHQRRVLALQLMPLQRLGQQRLEARPVHQPRQRVMRGLVAQPRGHLAQAPGHAQCALVQRAVDGQPQPHQQAGEQRQHDQQHAGDALGRDAHHLAELQHQRPDARVHALGTLAQFDHPGHVGRARRVLGVDLRTDQRQLGSQGAAHAPQVHGAHHRREVPEDPEQPHDAIHVAGRQAGGPDAGADQGELGFLALELLVRVVEGQRHVHLGQEALVVHLIAAVGIAPEFVHGLVLGHRPQRQAVLGRARPGHHQHAGDARGQHQHHHQQQRPHRAQGPQPGYALRGVGSRAGRHVAERGPCGSCPWQCNDCRAQAAAV